MSTNFDRNNILALQDAYNEFREIEYRFKKDSFVAYTDGSFKDGFAGAGVAIYQSGLRVREITAPAGQNIQITMLNFMLFSWS